MSHKGLENVAKEALREGPEVIDLTVPGISLQNKPEHPPQLGNMM